MQVYSNSIPPPQTYPSTDSSCRAEVGTGALMWTQEGSGSETEALGHADPAMGHPQCVPELKACSAALEVQGDPAGRSGRQWLVSQTASHWELRKSPRIHFQHRCFWKPLQSPAGAAGALSLLQTGLPSFQMQLSQGDALPRDFGNGLPRSERMVLCPM